MNAADHGHLFYDGKDYVACPAEALLGEVDQGIRMADVGEVRMQAIESASSDSELDRSVRIILLSVSSSKDF